MIDLIFQSKSRKSKFGSIGTPAWNARDMEPRAAQVPVVGDAERTDSQYTRG
jgi:hypothetical protein